MAEASYEKYLVNKPMYEVGPGTKGRQSPTMTYMSNAQVPGCNTYIEFGWVWEMPVPNPHIPKHKHDHDEVVLHIGGDPNNPEDLGAEVEFLIGGQPMILNKTSAMFLPANLEHGPLTWKNVTRPHLQMAIHIGSGVFTPSSPDYYKLRNP